jgi:16S rRNA (adenine1518-N6/adenine1519-N6)-dimethyltransferase
MRQPPRAKKALGQNFLTDNSVIDRIASALDLSVSDVVLEIGPGRGALTERLIDSGAKVLAVELDRDLIPELSKQFAGASNFRLIEGDALDVDFDAVSDVPIKLAANLPYYISTAILQRLIESRSCFSDLVLMFQREVVERITAPPGKSALGFLSVLCEACFESEVLFDVPPEAFRPIPKVWSSVVRLRPQRVDLDIVPLKRLASTAFVHRRKTLLNNLRFVYPDVGARLMDIGIDPKRRAEHLTLDEWFRAAAELEHRA